MRKNDQCRPTRKSAHERGESLLPASLDFRFQIPSLSPQIHFSSSTFLQSMGAEIGFGDESLQLQLHLELQSQFFFALLCLITLQPKLNIRWLFSLSVRSNFHCLAPTGQSLLLAIGSTWQMSLCSSGRAGSRLAPLEQLLPSVSEGNIITSSSSSGGRGNNNGHLSDLNGANNYSHEKFLLLLDQNKKRWEFVFLSQVRSTFLIGTSDKPNN